MRWTDLPAATPVRLFAAWSARAQDGGALDRAALAVLRARMLAASGPLVLVDAGAIAAAHDCVGHSAVERGGLLVGTPVALDDEDGPLALVHVRLAIAGTEDDATPLSLRLEASVWSRANAARDADECVVGWFHSHPGLGAFFSATDRRTQAAFFPHAFSLGWVIDPGRREEAWFAGPACAPVPAAAVIAGPRRV